ncbi:MAG: cyclic nucleotide-binding domain-containing protein [Anaerolineales bacterium]
MSENNALLDIFHVIPWFQQLSEDHIGLLADFSHLVEIPQGKDLFKEGDKEDFLYVVVNGRIAIEIMFPGRGRVSIYTAEPMDVVGWSSVTPVVRQRTASARAVLDSRLIAMDAGALRRLCEGDCALGCVVMRRIANVVAQRLLVTRLQLLDLFANPGDVKVHA